MTMRLHPTSTPSIQVVREGRTKKSKMKFWLFNIIYLVIDIVIVINKEKLNKRNLRLEQSTNSADQFTEILLITDEKYRDQQLTIDQNAHSEYIHGVCWSI